MIHVHTHDTLIGLYAYVFLCLHFLIRVISFRRKLKNREKIEVEEPLELNHPLRITPFQVMKDINSIKTAIGKTYFRCTWHAKMILMHS